MSETTELAAARQRRYDHREQQSVIDSQVASIVGASMRNFSTEWPAALYAVERMMLQDWGFRCEPCGGIWWADFWRNSRAYRASAESGPLAICKAIVATTEQES